MPYVYKYTDKKDNIVKYVGIIKSETNFPKRFLQHKNDDWYSSGDWEISYMKVPTATDAEALEAHFISKYGTAEYHNKAKTKWGECSFVPYEYEYYDWTVWENESFNKSPEAELWKIEWAIERCVNEVSRLERIAKDKLHDLQRVKRASARAWFRDTFYETCYDSRGWNRRYSIEDGYENYKAWCEENNEVRVPGKYNGEPHWFDTVGEFFDTLADCYDLRLFLHDNCICGVLDKHSEDGKKYREEMYKSIEKLNDYY